MLGLPALCSDIAPFRELAGEAAIFFELKPQALEKALNEADPRPTRIELAARTQRAELGEVGWNVFLRDLPSE
jgi:hypothetical protein